MRTSIVLLTLFAAASPLMAQSEEQLRNYFEGKSVIVKMEMPGSEDGVDVYPGRTQTIDFPKHASRLKDFGTSLKRGQEVLVTKVKVKKDLIEFQLGGGGYGTFGDDASSYISVPTAPKTEREKNLERDIAKTKDEKLLRQMKEELDALRKRREREDARNRAEAEQARQVKEANIRQRRSESGSRFNIRFKPAVPAEALTPEGVMHALAEFVDFAPIAGGDVAVKASGSTGKADDLRKGLSAEQVDALLGRPESIAQKAEGTLSVSISTYRKDGRVISAEFVEGVLVRYTIKSQ
jgi:hypothetical protein